jgi:hypothetical protein
LAYHSGSSASKAYELASQIQSLPLSHLSHHQSPAVASFVASGRDEQCHYRECISRLLGVSVLGFVHLALWVERTSESKKSKHTIIQILHWAGMASGVRGLMFSLTCIMPFLDNAIEDISTGHELHDNVKVTRFFKQIIQCDNVLRFERL